MKSTEEILEILDAFVHTYENCTNRNKSESVFWEQQENMRNSEVYEARADIYNLVKEDMVNIIKWIKE